MKLIKQAAERAAADADDIKAQSYIEEIANAITDAVAATSQTYVDALKNTGNFTPEAQKADAQKALPALESVTDTTAVAASTAAATAATIAQAAIQQLASEPSAPEQTT